MRAAIRFLALIAAALLVAPALAALPALSDEAKARAAEAAAKTVWSGNVDNYLLCKAQDRVAERYRASAAAAGKPVPTATATPPCTDPGPFVYAPPQPEAKPLEAAGAHSPPATAASPPSTLQPAAGANPTPKAQ